MHGRGRSRLTLWAFLLLVSAFTTSAAQAAPPPPAFLPGQPMIVGRQVLMMWNPVPGASAYYVYRNGARVDRVTGNQHLAPLPEEPGDYRYEVTAIDASGAEGDRSQPGMIRVRQLTSPKNLTSRPDPVSNAIGLVWDKSPGAVIYNVYRSREGEPRRLLSSVQEESYKDGDIHVGTVYTYEVAAKDLAGIESPPSQPVKAKLAAPERQVQKKVTFRALPTVEELVVDNINGTALQHVSHLSIGPKGNVWVVTPKTRQIHVLGGDGIPLTTLGPFTFDTTKLVLIPQKLAFGSDGNVYLTDAFNSVLACIDPTGNLVWARGILTPPPDLDDIWKDFPAHLKNLPPTPSSVLCLEQEIWVTDERFQIIYRFDYKGNLLGYLAGYEQKGAKVRFPGIGELAMIGDDRLIVTFPLSHWIAVLDRRLKLTAEIGANARGFIGGLVGVHGVEGWAKDQVLVTDPAVRTIQVFDAKTGAYLHHLSGPQPRRDPQYEHRADLAIGRPNFATRDPSGRVWVFDAAQKRIVALRPTGTVTPPLDAGE